MYTIFLTLHALFRWLALIILLIAIVRAYYGWLAQKPFTNTDNSVRLATTTTLHIQFLLGLALYFLSPLVEYFLNNFSDAVHERQYRFFGMEHSLMMLVGIVLITIGSASAKRKDTAKKKFKTMAIWFTIGLIIILINIPWPFSPFASRPWLRWF